MSYSESDIAERIDAMLAEAGWPEQLSPEQLAPLDQYHAGGLAATDRVVEALGVSSQDRVLDAGSGFGGVARRISQKSGARVNGVDITPGYVTAAESLTRRCGLDELVTYEVGDITELVATGVYDAAVSVHVQMNIEDKVKFFSSIRGALKPGGRLVIWDVCCDSEAGLTWPLPWSHDGENSFVASQDALKAAAIKAGFSVGQWNDETESVNKAFSRAFASEPPSGPALPKLLDNGLVRVVNFASDLADGSVSIVFGVLINSAS